MAACSPPAGKYTVTPKIRFILTQQAYYSGESKIRYFVWEHVYMAYPSLSQTKNKPFCGGLYMDLLECFLGCVSWLQVYGENYE